MKNDISIFEESKIRRIYDEDSETWYFSVIDIVRVLTDQPTQDLARNYWKVLKSRLKKEGSELVTNCNQLKLILYEYFSMLNFFRLPRPTLQMNGQKNVDFLLCVILYKR